MSDISRLTGHKGRPVSSQPWVNEMTAPGWQLSCEPGKVWAAIRLLLALTGKPCRRPTDIQVRRKRLAIEMVWKVFEFLPRYEVENAHSGRRAGRTREDAENKWRMIQIAVDAAPLL